MSNVMSNNIEHFFYILVDHYISLLNCQFLAHLPIFKLGCLVSLFFSSSYILGIKLLIDEELVVIQIPGLMQLHLSIFSLSAIFVVLFRKP